MSGGLALAISPTDVNHLLLATDSGLLRTRNGGRDWVPEAPAVLLGAVFAVAFDADGERALASTALGIFRGDGRLGWQPLRVPDLATPAHAIVRGGAPGRAYLAGLEGFWRTDDWGDSWTEAAEGLPAGPVGAVVVQAGRAETVFVVAGGRLWESADGGLTWAAREAGLPAGGVETVAEDPSNPTVLWAAGRDRVYRSGDRGRTWHPAGDPLPETGTIVRGIAAGLSGQELVLATHRGLYRSARSGRTWELLLENLPAHLEGGPLVRDPVDPMTLYAGFSLTPYEELFRMAAHGETLFQRLDASSLAGGVAFLLALGLGAVGAVRWLYR